MVISIRQSDFDSFFKAPFAAYPEDTLYVSPMKDALSRFLSTEKNPLFVNQDDLAIFTAHEGGTLLGRITAHVHRASNQCYDTNRAYFGFFDCADRLDAARALLDAAETWARERGFTELAGNFNMTAMQQIGVMTDGFENAPFTDQIYSPPHIARLLEACGYTRECPMRTVTIDLRGFTTDQLVGEKQRRILSGGDYSFAPVTRRTLSDRLEDARQILNVSFANNPMFMPLTKEEFAFQAADMKLVIDKRISVVAHHKGKPVGAVIAVPDLNPLVSAIGARFGWSTPWHFLKFRMRRRRAIIIFQGVLPDHQKIGLNPLLLGRALTAMKKARYETVGGTWIAEENTPSLRQGEKAGAKKLHGLHLYSKVLTNAE